MDLRKIIQDLNSEKAALERTISLLEELRDSGSGAPPSAVFRPLKRRGRKSMDPKERLEVSARMKRYWASRRDQPAAQ